MTARPFSTPAERQALDRRLYDLQCLAMCLSPWGDQKPLWDIEGELNADLNIWSLTRHPAFHVQVYHLRYPLAPTANLGYRAYDPPASAGIFDLAPTWTSWASVDQVQVLRGNDLYVLKDRYGDASDTHSAATLAPLPCGHPASAAAVRRASGAPGDCWWCQGFRPGGGPPMKVIDRRTNTRRGLVL